MSEVQEDKEEIIQQEDEEEENMRLLQQRQMDVLRALVNHTYQVMMDYITSLYLHTPYHTSVLSGEAWVQELLARHPKRIWNELGLHRSTFTLLIKAIKAPAVSLQSSCHVSIEEQLLIFLYTAVTGMSCTHIGEHFQRSSDTITK
jgi:hypothetical protein